METTLGKIALTLALIFVSASAAAVTSDEVEAELQALQMTPGTTVWTDQRLKIGKFRKLNSFAKITLRSGRIQEKVYCKQASICDAIHIHAELDSGEAVVLELGPAGVWRTGQYGTLDLAFSRTDPHKKYSKWGKRAIDAVANAQVYIGMTSAQAKMSWGHPTDIRTTQTKSVKHEQWIYGDPLDRASYLYLDNGKISAVQQ